MLRERLFVGVLSYVAKRCSLLEPLPRRRV
jgi:hypothetical protein